MAEKSTPESTPPLPRKPRRVVVPAPEGTEPHPEAEPTRHSGGENDERMKADKPPHY